MAEQFSIPTPGDVLADKYLILEELGRGAYGVVFRARQQGIERDVALKTLLPQAFLHQDIVERFHREAQLVSRLQHPNLVTLFDFGQSNGILYMVMELLEGRSLKALIEEETPIEPERAVHIISQICRALHAAHREGIVHRDLKPENIFLTQYEEDSDFVKVLDFGIAKIQHGETSSPMLKTLTVKGYVLGTPHYMSPENISGEPVTAAADIYAVGILLYELLVGEHPFDAPTPSAVLVRHLHDDVPRLPDPELDQSPLGTAIQCALAKDPEARVASATEFIDILNGEYEAEVVPVAEPAAEPVDEPIDEPPITVPGQRSTTLFAVLATLILLLTILLGVMLLTNEDGPVATPEVAQDGGDDGATSVTYDFAPEEVAEANDAGDAAEAALEVDAASADAAVVESGDASSAAPAAKAGSEDEAANTGGESEEARKPRENKPAHTLVSFASDPSGAKVAVNGQPAGITPCQQRVTQGDRVRVSISKIGYKTETRILSPKGRSQTVSVKLKPGRIKLSP
ncbi:MAG: hypothetical protein CMH57_09160 [Myxococcales bacterium]|nr:hypothetical protein [Myxococcales bacterium]